MIVVIDNIACLNQKRFGSKKIILYYIMFSNLLFVFFLANAIFWGFATHGQHCLLAAKMGITKCPPHWIHVYVMGLGSFIAALYLKQGTAGL